MPGLQEAFYIIAIVFMGIMFVLLIALVTAVFVIRNKINRIHHNIEEKIGTATALAGRGSELAAKAAGKVLRKARDNTRRRR